MTDTKTNTACRVIVVDDDEDFAGSIVDVFKSHGYRSNLRVNVKAYADFKREYRYRQGPQASGAYWAGIQECSG